MAEITAALVKELREKSGAGVMDAKKHWLKLTVISKSDRIASRKRYG